MLMGAPLVEAEQDSSIGIEDLPKVIMGRRGSRLTEQRLVPFQAARHVAYPYDRPRALHRVPLCGLILVCFGNAPFPLSRLLLCHLPRPSLTAAGDRPCSRGKWRVIQDE